MNRSKITLKERLFLFFTAIHLILIILVCINSSINAYNLVFNENVKNPPLTKITDAIKLVLRIPLTQQYSVMAGIDAGYGFFAPNVASGYVLQFSIKDTSNTVIRQVYLPKLKTNEGLIRYNTLLGAFQARFKALDDERKKIGKSKNKVASNKSLYTRYLDVVIKSIGRNIWLSNNDYSKDQKMSATLYLYEFPNLKESLMGDYKPELINILTLEVNKK
ncbi:hypothetical protein [Pedobacter sp. WC2423]|uniref:hypothetical protein n=1 Tax=Pedobacter sp. WC2423 TaxID=3234142 RepID=UPI0034653913